MKLRWQHGTGDVTPYKAEGSRGTYRIVAHSDGRRWTAWLRPGGHSAFQLGGYATPQSAREACQRWDDVERR